MLSPIQVYCILSGPLVPAARPSRRIWTMLITMGENDVGAGKPAETEKAGFDAELGQSSDIGIFKDGLKVQHPEPTADPLDPLNWSRWRKHTILAIVMYL